MFQDKHRIELTFNKNVSGKIDGEKLFVDAFSITTNFSFKYKNEFLIIVLSIDNLDRHYIYYLTDLLNKIVYKS